MSSFISANTTGPRFSVLRQMSSASCVQLMLMMWLLPVRGTVETLLCVYQQHPLSAPTPGCLLKRGSSRGIFSSEVRERNVSGGGEATGGFKKGGDCLTYPTCNPTKTNLQSKLRAITQPPLQDTEISCSLTKTRRESYPGKRP